MRLVAYPRRPRRASLTPEPGGRRLGDPMSWMAHLLERGRQWHGDRIAVIDGHRHVTYAALDRRTDGLAAAFLAMGVEPGHRVVVISHNRLEVLETYFALGKIGAIAVPVHYGAVPDEVAAMVKECGAAAIVGEADLVRRVPGTSDCFSLTFGSAEYDGAVTGDTESSTHRVTEDELMFILHTSATTGRPKGVCVDHGSLRSVTQAYLADVRPDDDVVFLHCGPLSHGAMVLPLVYMAAGATVVLMRMFTPPECLAVIGRAAVTHLFLVPDMLRFILQSTGLRQATLTSLREVIYAAAPMPRPLLLEARAALGCDFRQVYGITEGGGPVATLAPSEHDYRPGEARGAAASVGRAILGTVIRPRTDTNHGAPSGRIGELWVYGPGVMRRYWDDPAATDEAMRDGWVRTGDLGTVDEGGYVHLSGRVKDVIIRGGQKIFPAEVEQALLGHPAVREVCVVGAPSEQWGEVPIAYVVASGAADGLVASLRELSRERLASYKRPVEYEIVAALPRNAAGKVTRRELRAQAAGYAEQLSEPEPRSEG
ncbi:AMP-binding protein [Polymorphospora sp. NPDC051019]|uniref:class I adenylate-forming enzyme family protein n=1 Tax=Polymorphospora sp. NPDC051019 TaxID=3155725 RepID=UPI0034198383